MKLTPRQHLLIKAQHAEWPDSHILTHEEMLREWVCKVPHYSFEEWMADHHHRAGISDSLLLNLYTLDKLRHDFEYANRLLAVLASIIANRREVVFYECGEPDSRGRRFRGARYGLRPEQYISGFPGGKL